MTKFKQRGGTFLGLILGIMIGLGVALAVAIYVTKVPVPFFKNPVHSGQGAAEADKNRDWDPNAALRGRNGARPAPAGGGADTGALAPAPEPAAVPMPAEVRQAPAAPVPVVRPPARPPSNDPLGDFAAAHVAARSPAPANPPPAAAADSFTYFVQAGAFRTPGEAQAQRARLSLLGVQAGVSERDQAGRTVYRVRVGPFQNKDAADRVKERLDGNGLESALVRVQR